MTATEIHSWMAFYQLEKEDLDTEIAKAKEEAKAEAENK